MSDPQTARQRAYIFNLSHSGPELWVSSTFPGKVIGIAIDEEDNVTAHIEDGRNIDLGVQAWPVVKALMAVEVVPIVCQDSDGRRVTSYAARREKING